MQLPGICHLVSGYSLAMVGTLGVVRVASRVLPIVEASIVASDGAAERAWLGRVGPHAVVMDAVAVLALHTQRVHDKVLCPALPACVVLHAVMVANACATIFGQVRPERLEPLLAKRVLAELLLVAVRAPHVLWMFKVVQLLLSGALGRPACVVPVERLRDVALPRRLGLSHLTRD